MCRIGSREGDTYSFELGATYTSEHNVAPTEQPTEASQPTMGWIKAIVFRYNHDVDDLSKGDRWIALLQMTRAIPPVLEMRKYLLQNPGNRLSSWKRMEKSVISLLSWIVSSNRSYIVQDGTVPGKSSEPTNATNAKGTSLVIEKLEGEWVKFHFAQGSPEKDQRFNTALQSLRTQDNLPLAVPTIFAWHGSPLRNWHSIIRTSLDFSRTSHGRSFGHGVYFSPSFNISLSYCSGGTSGPSVSKNILIVYSC